MTKQERALFNKLTIDRTENANIIEKPSMRGVKSTVVEKYSDQAHFIYELLQNADDAGATSARFVLEEERLIFAHNGTRFFSVSNPDTEDEDGKNGTLGDINAITSIANSNKTEATIGKFGVGFKAVFRYTATPHIYDPNFHFRIERFVVPVILDEDSPERNASINETLFVFPFDVPERKPEKSYREIANKLSNLSYPLLFLNQLGKISFEYGEIKGSYQKSVEETKKYRNILAEKILVERLTGEKNNQETLWLFSKENPSAQKYSVGFFLTKEGKLRPVREPAFCFFPTKETTDLNFIIHAPFLLTDSREGILAGEKHNEKMIQSLAELAANAMVFLKRIGGKSHRLIDDNIVDIIPYDPDKFHDINNKDKVSFLPFYQEIKEIFSTNELLPTKSGYTISNNAYWASVPYLTKLFSDEQLAEITENKEAHWVFSSFSRDAVLQNKKPLARYIDALVKGNLTEEHILNGRKRGEHYDYLTNRWIQQDKIKGITESFIENQSIKWLHSFYKWLSETKNRRKIAQTKPVFLDQNGKAVSVFADEKQEHLILFKSVPGIEGYTFVNDKLLKNRDTSKFLKELGVKKPETKDYIYNIVLPKYRRNEVKKNEHEQHFKLFFSYFCSCSKNELDHFIDLIKDCEFLKGKDGNNKPCFTKASNLYFPTDELKDYFKTKPSACFLDYNYYQKLAKGPEEKELLPFISQLGVEKAVRTITEYIDYDNSGRTDLPNPYSTQYIFWQEKVIDGCKEILESITQNKNKNQSVLLWDTLLTLCAKDNIEELITGEVSYFYRISKWDYFESSDKLLLKNTDWLVNEQGEFIAPINLFRDQMTSLYETHTDEAEMLIHFLGIKEEKKEPSEIEDDRFTEEEKEIFEIGNYFKSLGYDQNDLKEVVKELEKRKISGSRQTGNGSREIVFRDDLDDVFEEAELEASLNNKQKKKVSKSKRNIVRDIVEMTKDETKYPNVEENLDEEIDQDDYMPIAVDYSRKIERAKAKSAAEIDRIAYYESLQDKALKVPKYSFSWFNTLLEMESIDKKEENKGSREVTIIFANIEREIGTNRTFVLKNPNRYIPQFMEDLADIPLMLNFGDQTKKLIIEVASIRSYTLRVKVKSTDAIEHLDLSLVNTAVIEAKSPVFLLEELRTQFEALNLPERFNLQRKLPKNIEFVFGPPGTGKTTHLAKNVLIPMMRKKKGYKVLVLAPTNKAADVLVKKIMDVSGRSKTYQDWLVRFGITGDEQIEQEPVFKEKTFDIRKLEKNVTVTTIARFPYDFFMPPGERIYLHSIDWDYIVIDEASMIPLAQIMLPLYKKTPKKFIIAGDPFQIAPIASVSLWKDENIYTMVKLDSFTEPKTIPHDYKVELLTTQYRSLPAIGDIFSQFAYGGILQHFRQVESHHPLELGNDFLLNTLNIIKFPVSKYESIYRSKRLQHSSVYQIYSALFAFEFCNWLAKRISSGNLKKTFKIGMIAPYRAQADMIDKLLSSVKLPKRIDVQVGTIHGFQGDECDMIFVVFNAPPHITASKEMFLNKKNILNVAVSRAKDYLVILMPDDETENIDKLKMVKQIENLCCDSECCSQYRSPDIEEMIFGEKHYLENNAFSTSHQNVNVYGLPEKRYEIRTEDTAVDVQVHRGR